MAPSITVAIPRIQSDSCATKWRSGLRERPTTRPRRSVDIRPSQRRTFPQGKRRGGNHYGWTLMAHAWRQKCSRYRRRSCTTSVIGRRETPSVHTDAIISLARAGQQAAPPTGGGRRSKRGEMRRKTGSRHKLFSGLTERLESAAVNGLVITNAGVITHRYKQHQRKANQSRVGATVGYQAAPVS